MKKMKMRTSALVGGQKNRACALVDRRLRDLCQAVEAKRYLKRVVKYGRSQNIREGTVRKKEGSKCGGTAKLYWHGDL